MIPPGATCQTQCGVSPLGLPPPFWAASCRKVPLIGYAGSRERLRSLFRRAGRRPEGRRVAVGTAVARCPPHSPVLALLTHTVLTLDLGIFGVEKHSRIRLCCFAHTL